MSKGAPSRVKPGILWVARWVEVSLRLRLAVPCPAVQPAPWLAAWADALQEARMEAWLSLVPEQRRGQQSEGWTLCPPTESTLCCPLGEGRLAILGPRIDGVWSQGWEAWQPSGSPLLGGQMSPATMVGLKHQPQEGFASGWVSPIPGRLDREVSGFTADLQGKLGRGGIRW